MDREKWARASYRLDARHWQPARNRGKTWEEHGKNATHPQRGARLPLRKFPGAQSSATAPTAASCHPYQRVTLLFLRTPPRFPMFAPAPPNLCKNALRGPNLGHRFQTTVASHNHRIPPRIRGIPAILGHSRRGDYALQQPANVYEL